MAVKKTYRCKQCGHKWESNRPLATSPPRKCPVCKSKDWNKKKSEGGLVPKQKPLTMKQRNLVKGIAEGKTQKQAALDAGYSEKSVETIASQMLAKPQVRASLVDLMDEMGLSDKYLLEKHKELIEATKVVSAIGGKDAGAGSVDFIDVPDNQARAKGIEMAYKLKGAFTEKVEQSGPNGGPQEHLVSHADTPEKIDAFRARFMKHKNG